MLNIDVSKRQKLLLYDLVKLLHDETGRPLVDWLSEIARAVLCGRLILRPTPFWQLTNRCAIDLRGLVSQDINWTFGVSVLRQYGLQTHSIDEPQELRASIEKERIEIHREDFREWWEGSDCGELPRFWFTKKEIQKNIGQALADARHSKTAPSKSAISEITNRIIKKESSGEYWHQSIEVKAWLSNNPGSNTTAKRLTDKVNIELKTKGIQPIKNAPRKE